MLVSAYSPNLTTVPVIDFAPFLTGDAAEKGEVAAQIYHACHTIGFLTLTNHGVPESLVEKLFHATREFFHLPLEVKNRLKRSSETNCGYIALATERLNPDRPWDWKEAFNVGRQSLWLADDDFSQTMQEFYQFCTTTTAIKVLQAFAIGLDLPEHFFDDKHKELFFLRLLHYPPIPGGGEPGQIRAGEHTDYGSVTLLFQDDVGGLEVCTQQGEWVPVPYVPGSIVINVGDAMQRWTNDRLRSTPHRVVNPAGESARRDRYSIALFCDPNPDVELACLASCTTPDNPPKYAPILTGDYLRSRLEATY